MTIHWYARPCGVSGLSSVAGSVIAASCRNIWSSRESEVGLSNGVGTATGAAVVGSGVAGTGAAVGSSGVSVGAWVVGLGVVGDGVSGSSGVGRDVGSPGTGTTVGAWLVGEGVDSPGSGVGTSGASVGGFVSPGPFVGGDVSTTGGAVGGLLVGDLVGVSSPHSGEQQSHTTSEHSTERILQSSFSALAIHTSSGIDPSRLLPSNLATAIGIKLTSRRRSNCGQIMRKRERHSNHQIYEGSILTYG